MRVSLCIYAAIALFRRSSTGSASFVAGLWSSTRKARWLVGVFRLSSFENVLSTSTHVTLSGAESMKSWSVGALVASALFPLLEELAKLCCSALQSLACRNVWTIASENPLSADVTCSPWLVLKSYTLRFPFAVTTTSLSAFGVWPQLAMLHSAQRSIGSFDVHADQISAWLSYIFIVTLPGSAPGLTKADRQRPTGSRQNVSSSLGDGFLWSSISWLYSTVLCGALPMFLVCCSLSVLTLHCGWHWSIF